jgi:hypothetical protein
MKSRFCTGGFFKEAVCVTPMPAWLDEKFSFRAGDATWPVQASFWLTVNVAHAEAEHFLAADG